MSHNSSLMIGVLFQQFFALLTEGRPPGQRTSLSHAESSKKNVTILHPVRRSGTFLFVRCWCVRSVHVIVGLFVFFQFLSFCLLLCFFVSLFLSLFLCLLVCFFVCLLLCFFVSVQFFCFFPCFVSRLVILFLHFLDFGFVLLFCSCLFVLHRKTTATKKQPLQLVSAHCLCFVPMFRPLSRLCLCLSFSFSLCLSSLRLFLSLSLSPSLSLSLSLRVSLSVSLLSVSLSFCRCLKNTFAVRRKHRRAKKTPFGCRKNTISVLRKHRCELLKKHRRCRENTAMLEKYHFDAQKTLLFRYWKKPSRRRKNTRASKNTVLMLEKCFPSRAEKTPWMQRKP